MIDYQSELRVKKQDKKVKTATLQYFTTDYLVSF